MKNPKSVTGSCRHPSLRSKEVKKRIRERKNDSASSTTRQQTWKRQETVLTLNVKALAL
jgi:hypothetical protein